MLRWNSLNKLWILNSVLASREIKLGITEFASMTLSVTISMTLLMALISVCCYSETSEENVTKQKRKNLTVIVVPIRATGSMPSFVFHFRYEILLKILLIYIKYFRFICEKFCSWKNKIIEGMVRLWRVWQGQKCESKDNTPQFWLWEKG